jgi:N-acetylmuramoyl-L-alanine amidase
LRLYASESGDVVERSMGKKIGTIGLFAIAFVLGIAYVLWLTTSMSSDEPTATVPATSRPAVAGPTRTLRPTRTPGATQTPEVPPSPNPLFRDVKVGIVAGHWRHDPGAVCPDGLKEVEINRDVGSRVVTSLQQKGYTAELLPEFSDKLDGYEADAFVSIHTDSCGVPDASGFKVARVSGSVIPKEEDRLVACLVQEYGQATGLRFHKNSITFDMTSYHAFREIAPGTPGAIIELGFMDADRELLTERSPEVAQAVVQGIVCFLEGD